MANIKEIIKANKLPFIALTGFIVFFVIVIFIVVVSSKVANKSNPLADMASDQKLNTKLQKPQNPQANEPFSPFNGDEQIVKDETNLKNKGKPMFNPTADADAVSTKTKTNAIKQYQNQHQTNTDKKNPVKPQQVTTVKKNSNTIPIENFSIEETYSDSTDRGNVSNLRYPNSKNVVVKHQQNYQDQVPLSTTQSQTANKHTDNDQNPINSEPEVDAGSDNPLIASSGLQKLDEEIEKKKKLLALAKINLNIAQVESQTKGYKKPQINEFEKSQMYYQHEKNLMKKTEPEIKAGNFIVVGLSGNTHDVTSHKALLRDNDSNLTFLVTEGQKIETTGETVKSINLKTGEVITDKKTYILSK